MALVHVIVSLMITAHDIIDSAGAYYTYANTSIKGYSNDGRLKGEKKSKNSFKTKKHDNIYETEQIQTARFFFDTMPVVSLEEFGPWDPDIPQKCTMFEQKTVHNTVYGAVRCVYNVNWTDAFHDCKSKFPGGSLAVITGPLRQTAVFNMFLAERLLPVFRDCEWCALWIGLANETNDKNYRYNNWIDGTPVRYTNWIPGQPSYTWGTEKHVSMVFSKLGQWNDKNMNDLNVKHYACQKHKETNLNCTEHDTWRYNHSLIQLVDCDVEISWFEAERDCVQKGGHLVSIADEYEQNIVLDYVQQHYNECPLDKCRKGECICRFWIGLIQNAEKDYRLWSDESEVTYTNFESRYHSSVEFTIGVVIRSTDGLWQELISGHVQKQYICEVPYTTEEDQYRGFFLQEFSLRIGDCPGYNLLKHPLVYSLEQCAAFCHRSFHCDGFVYKPVGRGRGECSPKVPIMKRYCKNPVAVPGVAVLAYYLITDKVYDIHSYYFARAGACSSYDNQYNFTRKMTLEECETLCWIDKTCFGFTFNFNNCSYDKWCGCYIKYLPINEICPHLEPKLVVYTYTVKVIQYPIFYHDFKRQVGICLETPTQKFLSVQNWPVKICGETCRESKSCYGFAINYFIKRNGFPRCHLYTYQQLNCRLETQLQKQGGIFSWFKTCCNGIGLGERYCAICDTCEKAALDDVTAVCASNKQIYQNHCFLMCDICRTGHPMTVIKDMAYCTGKFARNQRIINRMRKTLYISEINTCDEACTYCYRVHRTNFAKWHDKDYILNFQSCLDKCVHSGVAPRDSLECEMTKKEYGSIYYVNITQVKTVDVMTGLTLG